MTGKKMKLCAFAASNSKQSINKALVTYACSLLSEAEAQILDINDYEMPIFSVDREQESGQPQLAHDFLARIAEADALVVSYAEHNGSYSAAFKNIFDWCSRIEKQVWQGKPMVLLSTSPGSRGGATVLELAQTSASYFDGKVKATLAVPNFHENFDLEKGVMSNEALAQELKQVMGSL